MRMLLGQYRAHVGDLEANTATLKDAISKTDAELLIFPELFLSGYAPRDEIPSMADRIDEGLISDISNICSEASKGIIVGAPLKHRSIRGQITNSALLINEKGEICRYDKTYLPTFGPFEESFHFAPGNSAPIISIAGIKVGAIICYDIFFPELVKLYALRGADLVVCISASPTATVENFSRIIPARAIESSVYLAYVNSVGTHLSLVFGGSSRLVDARGNLVAEAEAVEENPITAEMDPAQLALSRRTRPTLRDSRREILERMLDEMNFS